MTNALGSEHNGVLQVLDISLVSFTRMEESGHFLVATVMDGYLVLVVEDGVSEGTDLWRKVFLINQIEAGDELREPLVLETRTNLNVLQHFLDMALANNLESRNDQSEVKVRIVLLQLIDDFTDELEFRDEVNWLLVFVKDTA